MPTDTQNGSAGNGGMPEPATTVDYATPEARRALEDVTRLVLEVRDEQTGPLNRKIALYERTLGLAVVPVLLRRALIAIARRLREGRISS